jgi:hypothetical protein
LDYNPKRVLTTTGSQKNLYTSSDIIQILKLKIHKKLMEILLKVISDDIVLKNEKDVISFIEELTLFEGRGKYIYLDCSF